MSGQALGDRLASSASHKCKAFLSPLICDLALAQNAVGVVGRIRSIPEESSGAKSKRALCNWVTEHLSPVREAIGSVGLV